MLHFKYFDVRSDFVFIEAEMSIKVLTDRWAAIPLLPGDVALVRASASRVPDTTEYGTEAKLTVPESASSSCQVCVLGSGGGMGLVVKGRVQYTVTLAVIAAYTSKANSGFSLQVPYVCVDISDVPGIGVALCGRSDHLGPRNGGGGVFF